MTVRKLINVLHLWIGISAGLVISIVGLTGAIYVFAPEFQAAPINDKIAVRQRQRPIDPYDIAVAAEQKYGRRLVSFQNQRRAEQYYTISLIKPKLKIAIDPYTGKELECFILENFDFKGVIVKQDTFQEEFNALPME